MQWKFDMVIQGEHGGFGLTAEIVDRLRERGCAWVQQCTQATGSGKWYVSAELEHDGVFRRDPIFVEVVRELTAKLDREGGPLLSWRDRKQLELDFVGGLRVVTVTVEVEISDEDGKESVRVIGGLW